MSMSSSQTMQRAGTARSSRRWRRVGLGCAALALVALAAYAAHQLALRSGMDELRTATEHRLDLLASGLNADLARFDDVPALLEMTPIVPALFEAPENPALREGVNRYLAGAAATLGAEMLYVLDGNGVSLAASDWDRPGTTVGQDLSFRPYVVDALRRGHGRFYGVGITSRRPGYYLSYALRHGDAPGGVLAIKVDLAGIENGWREQSADVLLLDERGVVILATREALKYRPLQSLDGSQQADVRRSRPYGDATLQPLPWTQVRRLGDDVALVALEGRERLAASRALRQAPWRLVVLADPAPQRRLARYAAATAALAMAVLLLAAVALWQRRRAVRQKLANQAALQAAHDSLEATVTARTAQLRAAQAELVHAGRMSALGQMSAVLVHELNQPLTAIRTLSDNASILLEQAHPQEVQDNLQRIVRMVDRLSRLTSRLKTFAYKSERPVQPVSLVDCLAEAHATVAELARRHGVQIEIDVQPADLQVLGDEASLDSVVLNLMRNAIDAMQSSPVRLLRIHASRHGERVWVEFRDSGPGIAPEILPRLFEPFVTSKQAGSGLGLGLVVSAEMLRGMQGSLTASNEDGGACFVVELKAFSTET
jgi:two-component system C4-dicarboxylate transport sensor histidine kinase DctB